MIVPVARDRQLVDMPAAAELLEPVTHTGDGKDAGELHYPPYQYLDREQRVAQHGADEGCQEDEKGYAGIVHIADIHTIAATPYYTPLRERTDEKQRREDKVDESIGYQDYPETDDQESIDHQWRIYTESTLHVLRLGSDQQ